MIPLGETDSPRVTWLHLSDLHMFRERDGYKSETMLRHLLDDLSRVQIEHHLQPELLFFTGDLAWGHVPNLTGGRLIEQFRDADIFLTRVRERFDPIIPKDRVFLVPGNHDVKRQGFAAGMFYWLERQFQEYDEGKKVLSEMIRTKDDNWMVFASRLGEYTQFLRDAGYGHLLTDPERLLYSLPVDLPNGVRLLITGLNSAWCSSRDDLSSSVEENGRISLCGDWQLSNAVAKRDKSRINIALVHHPLTWLQPNERSEASKIVETYFDFYLHGHEHDPWVSPGTSGRATRLAAGCTFGKDGDGDGGYNLVRLDPSRGKGTVFLRTYRRNTMEWVPSAGGGADDHGRLEINYNSHAIAAAVSNHEPVQSKSLKETLDMTTQLRSSKNYAASAYVVISDVHEFSGLDANSQRHVIQQLWTEHTASPHKGAISTPSGDGVMTVFPLNSDRDPGPSAKEVLDFATLILKNIRKASDTTSVRMGIHYGSVSVVRASRRQTVVIGTTVNDCHKIATFGDSNHILCSEAFVDRLSDEEHGTELQFDPPQHSDAFEVYKRKFSTLKIRMYAGDGASRIPPIRQAVSSAVEKNIMRTLSSISSTLVFGLKSSADKSKIELERGWEERLQVRVSLFARKLDRSVTYLLPTKFRDCPASSEHNKPGRTRYTGGGTGQGPVGLAYTNRSSVVVRDLPEWKDMKARDTYRKLLETYGLDARTVDEWQRHSRAMLCFPFGLLEASVRSAGDPRPDGPDGVICIDIMDPLSKFPEIDLITICDSIRESYNTQLSLAWRLRLVS